MRIADTLWYVAGATVLLAALAVLVPTAVLSVYLNSLALPLVLCMAVFTAPSLWQSTVALWRAACGRAEAERADLMVIGYHAVFAAALLSVVANIVRIALGGAPSATNAHLLIWSKASLILGAILLFWSGSIDRTGRVHNRGVFLVVLVAGVALAVVVQMLQQRGFATWATGSVEVVGPAIAATLDGALP